MFIVICVTLLFLSVADGALGLMQQNLEANQLVWISCNSEFASSVELPESINNGVKEMDFIADQVLVGLDMSVVPELLPLVLTYDEAKHEGDFLIHKTYEGAMQYFEQLTTDTSVFIEPGFTNAAVAETLKQSVDEEKFKPIADNMLQLFKTRYAKSRIGRKAAKWILEQFESLASSRDDIDVKSVKEPTTNQISVIVSIQGTVEGSGNVILGSHLDSISNHDGEMTDKKPAPGLDDDGSGVLVLLEILRVIVETGYQPENNVQLMAYAAEELGLLGSLQIAGDYKSEGKNVLGMLEFDGAGYQGGMPVDFLFTKDFSNNDHADFLGHLTQTYLPDYTYLFVTCSHECSDHSSWYLNGYPAGYASEAMQNPNYHTENDNIVDFDYMGKFARLGLVYLAELAKGTIQS